MSQTSDTTEEILLKDISSIDEIHPEHDPDEYTCWTYEEYKEHVKASFPNVSESLWKWFNFDDTILHYWRNGTYSIVFKDVDGDIIHLQDMEKKYPTLNQFEETWYKGIGKYKCVILQFGTQPIHPLLTSE